MADPKKQKAAPGSDEDDEEDHGDAQRQGEEKVETQPVSTSCGSNEPASSAKKGQKRKESDAAAGVDLSAMYEATPGCQKPTYKEGAPGRKKEDSKRAKSENQANQNGRPTAEKVYRKGEAAE